MSNYGNIVRGVRERDMQSQMMFYDFFIRSVYRSAYSIVENEHEAEEIAQDTMLKVLDRTDLLHDDAGAMERIMKRMAANAAIDVTRRRKNLILSSDEIPDAEEAEGSEDDDGYDFSIEEIKEGIALLPDIYRSILHLRLFEDVSFAEVADLLNINCSTVRVQYTRGIAKLRSVLLKKKNYA
ncbi:MAG: sigma-70 family RNA polymerase sigma factor [Tannerella sp.]|jgi:RNA polymerase sigma-70 factor (ECF subfamily)|nr:sigma-70 family RNA polymerase sigma factor [Tannerella sp.]